MGKTLELDGALIGYAREPAFAVLFHVKHNPSGGVESSDVDTCFSGAVCEYWPGGAVLVTALGCRALSATGTFHVKHGPWLARFKRS